MGNRDALMVIPSFQQWRDTQRFLKHFRLPQAASESFNHLFIVLVTLTSGELWWNDSPYAAVINKSIIGLYTLVVLTDLWDYSSQARLALTRCSAREKPVLSPGSLSPLFRFLAALVSATPAALLVAWSVSYLLDARISYLNRMVFSAWALYVITGCLYALVRGFVLWGRERRSVEPAAT